MLEDIDDALTLLRDAMEYSDTGYVRIPVELIGVKQAAARRGLSERTLRRRCAKHGIALKVGKTWLVVVDALDALQANDTGALCDAQHDIKTIRELTCWPISRSELRERGVIQNVPAFTSGGFALDNPITTNRLPEAFRFRMPEGMTAAMQYMARRRAQSTSDWVRQVLLDRLQEEGLSVTDTGSIGPPERP